MRSIVTPCAALAAALAFGSAQADPGDTETFEGAVASNAAYPAGPIAGTGIEVVAGSVWIAPTDAAQGNVLDLGSGWYAPNYDPVADVGSSAARSIATFDLLAGTTYTVSFDYSRQAWSAGNGPFPTSLIASLGSHAVTYQEVAGFYYGLDWHAGALTFTPTSDELGVHLVFTASAPAGYSGMVVDNIALVGLAPVPEPQSLALMLGGLGAVGMLARRRRPVAR